MNEQAQRIAIAEACGFTRGIHQWENIGANRKSEPMDCWFFNGHPCRRSPDYLHDLNAMHEAEKRFHRDHLEAEHYTHRLKSVVYRTKHSGTGTGLQWINATAMQRAEAFLRTLGKWAEE